MEQGNPALPPIGTLTSGAQKQGTAPITEEQAYHDDSGRILYQIQSGTISHTCQTERNHQNHSFGGNSHNATLSNGMPKMCYIQERFGHDEKTLVLTSIKRYQQQQSLKTPANNANNVNLFNDESVAVE